jgi:serine phosphatase RsbU (regulator of sigma subunit)
MEHVAVAEKIASLPPSAMELLPPEQRARALSGSRLSAVLVMFVTALLLVLGAMVFVLVSGIFAWLTPTIRADLEWKAQRAAAELSQTTDLGILLRDPQVIEKAFAGIASSRDVEAIVVVDPAGAMLAAHGHPPASIPALFRGPPRAVSELDGNIVSWSEAVVEGAQVGRVAVVVSTERLKAGQGLRLSLLGVVAVGTILGILISVLFVRFYIRPLLRVTETAFLRLEKAAVELAGKQQLERELEIGARIQTCILPKRVDIPGLEVASQMRPASEVGGDYFDVFGVEGGGWIGIGDVAGHGLTAGLVMLMAQSVVAALARRYPDAPPKEIVTQLNAVLYDNVRHRLGNDEHITLSLLRYHDDGRVVYAGAHEYILVCRAKTGKCELVSTTGTWLAAVDDVSSVTEDATLQLDAGDLMVLYTDGITEAMTAERELYGVRRLKALVEAHASESVQAVLTAILDQVERWRQTQRDDETVVVIRYTGLPRAELRPAAAEPIPRALASAPGGRLP